MAGQFYGPDQAAIHHTAFGDLARAAAELLRHRLGEAGLSRGTIVDLGCGSGILAAELAAAGYDVIGYDLSASMLELARVNAPTATFEQVSLIDAEIPDGVVAVTAVGESLNYATDQRAGLDAVRAVAQRVATALVSGGVFLGDVSTPGRGSRVVFHDHPGWSLGMVATESDDGTRLDRAITIFTLDPLLAAAGEPRFRKTEERHVLRLYQPADIVDALSDAGLNVVLERNYGEATSVPFPAHGWTVVSAVKPR